jgi:predicted Zn-dependent protease
LSHINYKNKEGGVSAMRIGKSIVLISLLLAFPHIVKTAIDKEKSQKFGYYTDRFLGSTETFVFDEKLNEKINEIGNRVEEAANSKNMQYTYRVINSPVINAYSVSGGFVYITTGLLDVLESEDELASIIAHEIHHINADHQIRFLYSAHRKKAAGEVGGLILGVFLGAALGQLGQSQSSISSSYNNSIITRQLVDLGMQAGQTISSALTISSIKGYGKKQELEADRYAVQHTKKAGYDPRAYVHVFERFIQIRDKLKMNKVAFISSLLNAKPGLEERIKKAKIFISDYNKKSRKYGEKNEKK